MLCAIYTACIGVKTLEIVIFNSILPYAVTQIPQVFRRMTISLQIVVVTYGGVDFVGFSYIVYTDSDARVR